MAGLMWGEANRHANITMSLHAGLVQDAIAAALVKHGEVTHDLCRGVVNLTEELGEVAAEIVEATRPNQSRSEHLRRLRLAYTELMQLAGYAMLLAERISDDNPGEE